MNDVIDWHSKIAYEFDGKYAHSRAFKERLAVWSDLIDQFVDPDSDVLDAGCGSGVFSTLAARKARFVMGFDASPEMIWLAEKRRRQEGCANAKFRLATLEDLTVIADRQFEVILCSSVLEYIEDFWRAFDRFAAVLKANGVLVFSMPNGVSLYRKAERVVFRLTGRPAYYAYMRNMSSVSEVSKGLTDRAFEIVTTRYYAPAPGLSAIARPIGRPDLADTLFAIACRRTC
jgi:2-polyprenyl-3-methyl-5-hydroxy-6-metoxy-1,4-benzoquinol methylase